MSTIIIQNPIGYVQLGTLVFVSCGNWQLLHKFVNFQYPFLNQQRRLNVHDKYVEAFLRISILISQGICGWTRLTKQLFVDLSDAQCWEFEYLCYTLTIVSIFAILQMFFGIATSKEMVIHHLVLLYSITDFVTNPQASDILIGYYVIVITAYGLVSIQLPFGVTYQIEMHYFEKTQIVEHLKNARKAARNRFIVLFVNLFLLWTLCCLWYFIQAIFVEGLWNDLQFMLSRFMTYILFWSVEMYILQITYRIMKKKDKQIEQFTKDIELSILRIPTPAYV